MCPSLDRTGQARVFIVSKSACLPWTIIQIASQGHATGQTTGLGGHMSARFIPTVERESIDLV